MRAVILGAMIVGGTIAGAAAQDRPRLFISPMGEPFRGAAPEDQWFDGADANKDNALTVEEMTADAARFFVTLDMRRDGEIDPQDIERYETQLVPEMHGADVSKRPRGNLKGDGTGPHGGGGFGSGPNQTARYRDLAGKQGAARFGYLDYPQPITVADRNFNRGVDPREFARAAETRFGMLDGNGDGRIEKSELPRLGR
jgi:hypothetical protein